MCAVAGVLTMAGGEALTVPEEVRGAVRRMNRAMAHRGPDDDTVFAAGPVVLGHRRLSIIDLDGGRQPIGNEDGTVFVILNGEIYNYRELTDRLTARGHRFRTRSDTEAIVHAYEEWGAAALRRLRGMFALAIADLKRGLLLIARDPVGEKPLYYHLAHHTAPSGPLGLLSFASEAKALLCLPWVRRQVDPAGIADYLRYRYIAAPRTAFLGLSKLPAGTYLEVSFRHSGPLPEPVPYWQVSYRPKLALSSRYLVPLVEEALSEAVSSRLIADVPLGLLLSGGLDSTLVLALMRRHLPAPGHEIRSFCAGFTDPCYDERPLAGQVAGALLVRHETCAVDERALQRLPTLLWHLDEPLGDPSIMPTFHVAELAASRVKAVLTGDGGDEAFAGYDRYRRSRLSDLLRALPRRPHRLLRRALDLIEAHGAGLIPREVLARARARLLRSQRACEAPLGHLFEQTMTAFSPAEVQLLLHEDHRELARPALCADRVADLFDRADAEHYLDRFLYSDLRSYLADDLMVKSDRMTMAHGLEARAPLLDVELLRLAAALPVAAKRRQGSPGKLILRQVLRRLLPRSICAPVLSQHKRGFTPPLQRWLESRTDQVQALLDAPTLVASGLLSGAGWRALAAAPGGSDRLFLLLLLEMWHRVVVLEERDLPLKATA
jgi:asparagine synthase (glutamine-hydrolysing)